MEFLDFSEYSDPPLLTSVTTHRALDYNRGENDMVSAEWDAQLVAKICKQIFPVEMSLPFIRAFIGSCLILDWGLSIAVVRNEWFFRHLLVTEWRAYPL